MVTPLHIPLKRFVRVPSRWLDGHARQRSWSFSLTAASDKSDCRRDPRIPAYTPTCAHRIMSKVEGRALACVHPVSNMAVTSPLRLTGLLVAGLFLFCVLQGVQVTPGDAAQRALNVQAESLRAAGCNHLISRDWSALPPQCKRAVHVSSGNDQKPIGNGSRKPEACKVDHCE